MSATMLRLVQPTAGPIYSQRTLECAQDLLDGVRTGQITGFAIVVKMKKDFFVDLVGECEEYPVLMRGAVASLDDRLAAAVKDQKELAEGRL